MVFTEELYAMATEMKVAGVTHAAMEATGSYWTALYLILEMHDIQVTVINPGHYKKCGRTKNRCH